jgi:hypothetical protein
MKTYKEFMDPIKATYKFRGKLTGVHKIVHTIDEATTSFGIEDAYDLYKAMEGTKSFKKYFMGHRSGFLSVPLKLITKEFGFTKDDIEEFDDVARDSGYSIDGNKLNIYLTGR